jgi:hypothetical protein
LDELESDQDDSQDFKQTKKKKSAKKQPNLHWESVVIPMGDKSAIEKFVSSRIREGQVEILVFFIEFFNFLGQV